MAELFKKILIATDGSKWTQNAVETGLKLAREQQSKVYVLYVVDTITFTSMPMDVTWVNMYQLLKDEGEGAVKAIKDSPDAQGLDVETNVLEGHPAVEITKFASDNGVDLIVIGTLGKSGIERILLGSTAEKVIRISHCPVLVIKSSKK